MEEIIVYPGKELRKKAARVDGWNKEVAGQAKRLEEILAGVKNGAGLAGPQIGVGKRMFAMKGEKGIRVLINPIVKATTGEAVFPTVVGEKGKEEPFLEGCLSFPDWYGTVKRYLRIGAEWQEGEGGKLVGKSGEFSGFLAIVFQHESDHLEGILLVDRVKESRGEWYRQEGEEMVRREFNF